MATSYVYDDRAIREDLLSFITNLSVKETYLVSTLGRGEVKSYVSEWLKDTIGAAKTNAYVEGAAGCYPSLTNPSRISNYTQIFRQGYQVSGTDEVADKAGFNSRFDYETQKAMSTIKIDMELAVLRGSMASGTGSAARKLRGIKNSLSLATSRSGTSLTEAILNDLFQLQWDNSSTETDTVLGDMYMKRKISGFTAGSTKFTEVADKRLIGVVSVYESDAAARVELVKHRYVTISGDTNHDLVGITKDFFKVAYLRGPVVKVNPVDIDGKSGEILVEATLQNKHHDCGFWAKQLL